MGGDIIYILWWWLVLVGIGIINYPLTWTLFNKFFDGGWGFSKVLGTIVVAYFIFITSVLKIIPFTQVSIYLVFIIFFVINYLIYTKNSKKIQVDLSKNRWVILISEILFLSGLFFWSYVRAHNPDIRGLEKFMDYGFITSILRTKYLPPADMWYSGEYINYYWFGHYWTAFLTKLTNIPSSVSYNLMIASIAGFGLSHAFSLTSTLLSKLKKPSWKISVSGGLIAAVMVIFAGNFHTPYFVLKNGVDKYWYPDATRFIGYNPDVADKTIHEFPIYSFVVSDLHAHLINFPLVILYLALLIRLAYSDKKREVLINSIICGVLLGIMFMTNAWDLANYLLTTGVVLFILNLKKFGMKYKLFYETSKKMLIIIATASVTIFPFVANFESIAEGVKFVHSQSALWQLLLLWGLPLILIISFSFFVIKNKKQVQTTDLIVLSLLISSIILIIIPEIIYVKDIYVATHYRANTMFKLTYQAFVMSYLSSGYVVMRILGQIDDLLLKRLAAVFYSLTLAVLLFYPWLSMKSYYANLKNYQGLPGIEWLKNTHPQTYEVIGWLNQNIDGQPTILEAPGDSYTDFNVVSSYTGLPTVTGWFVHEWLWRGSPDFPQKRVADIAVIYTSKDPDVVKKLINKYKIEYVIVGQFERQKYPGLSENIIKSLGDLAFRTGNTSVYKIN